METLKQINHDIYQEYIERHSNTELALSYQLLDYLYILHRVTYDLLDIDENVRDRILKAIKREQVKLEDKKYTEVYQ